VSHGHDDRSPIDALHSRKLFPNGLAMHRRHGLSRPGALIVWLRFLFRGFIREYFDKLTLTLTSEPPSLARSSMSTMHRSLTSNLLTTIRSSELSYVFYKRYSSTFSLWCRSNPTTRSTVSDNPIGRFRTRASEPELLANGTLRVWRTQRRLVSPVSQSQKGV
jgi:hypothetical protein